MLKWRNDIKCKYVFLFSLKNLARKGLRTLKPMQCIHTAGFLWDAQTWLKWNAGFKQSITVVSNKWHGVLNHRKLDCLLRSWFRLTKQKTWNFSLNGIVLWTNQWITTTPELSSYPGYATCLQEQHQMPKYPQLPRSCKHAEGCDHETVGTVKQSRYISTCRGWRLWHLSQSR